MTNLRRLGWVLLVVSIGCSSKQSKAPPAPTTEATAIPAATPAATPVAPAVQPAPEPPAPTPAKGGADFAAQATLLYRIGACGGDSAIPETFSAKMVDKHCKQLLAVYERYRTRWIDKAKPYLAGVVPAGLPDRIVYPFGGGDLMTALATFPDAVEITTVSLEFAGDVRNIETLKKDKLEASLDTNRENLRRLMAVAHSKTTNLSIVVRGDLPGQLIFSMAALALHGFEPVSLRYFTLEPDGDIHYLSLEEIERAEAAQKRQSKREELELFANAEIEYRPVGKPEAPLRVFRHMAWNLDDDHLTKDPAVLRHLEQKGKITAMTKAASFLLWWETFSMIRGYLLANMEWMISDATGILPDVAAGAGFEQITYGKFEGPFLPGAGKKGGEKMRKLWKGNPYQALPFRYGYPDNAQNAHMMVTRRPAR